MKYLHKSFSKGILSTSFITRTNIEQYSESAREIYNLIVGRQGEVYRRGGTAILEKLPFEGKRLVPFYSDDKTFIVAFGKGRITNSSSSNLVDCDNIRVIDVTDSDITKEDSEDFSSISNLDVDDVKVYGIGSETNIRPFEDYTLDVEEGIDEDELESMDFTQLGNLLIFTCGSLPPFYIRKEGEEFILYKSAMDLIVNGDGDDDLSNKALFTLPYSFYGFGFDLQDFDPNRTNNAFKFEAYLTLGPSVDTSGLSQENEKFWRNRAFVLSTNSPSEDIENEGNDIRIVGGIIRKMDIVSGSGRPSKYRLRGEFIVNDPTTLTELNERTSNLFLCDWSDRLGFPRSTAAYENRICFAGNKAYPNKLWYSSQPSVQRVQIGTKTRISPATTTAVETRTQEPIYKVVYYDQLDLLNKDAELLGLTLGQPASSGSYFVNDNLGFSIHWIVGGEVLYIGTNQGIFISSGTDATSASPIPFNTGFTLAVDTPVSKTFPIIVGKSFFYISDDNSINNLSFDSRNGYDSVPLDSLVRDVVDDPILKIEKVKKTVTHEFTVNLGTIGGLTEIPTVTPTRSPVSANLNFLLELSNIDTEVTQYDDDADDGLSARTYGNAYIDWTGGDTKFDTAVLDTLRDEDDDVTSSLYQRRNIKPRAEIGDLEKHSIDFYFLGALLGFDWSYDEEDDRDRFEIDCAWVVMVRLGERLFNYKFDYIRNDNGDDLERDRSFGENPSSPDQSRIIDSWIKGEISNGYVLPVFNHESPRLCGIYRDSSTRMTLAFDKQLPPVFEKIKIKDSSNQEFFDGDIPTLTNSTSADFGTADVVSIWSGEITLSRSLPTDGTEYTMEFYKGTELISSLKFKLEADAGGWRMLDNLKDPYSGKFYVYEEETEIYEDSLNEEPDNSGSNSKRFFLEAVNDELQNFNLKGSLEFTDLYTSNYETTGTNVITEAVESSIVLKEVVEGTETFPIFTSKTRMLYDWARKTFMIFRKDSPYLCLTFDNQTNVFAWTRGLMNLNQPIYIRNLRTVLPNKHPSIFGLNGENLLRLSYGRNVRDQQYIENLPNCVDNHIIIDTGDTTIDGRDLKSSLKNLGYENEDLIHIATHDNVLLENTKVEDIPDEIQNSDREPFIVGKKYNFVLTTFPIMNDRNPTLGHRHSFKKIIFSSILDTDFNINSNKKDTKIDTAFYPDKYGTAFYEQNVNSFISYDPFLEIAGESAFPFCITGYILDVDKKEENK